MYNILTIGKELPDNLDFCEALKGTENKVFSSVKSESAEINFDAENIFAATWNKSSAVSAHSFLIKAETKLQNLTHVIFYFDTVSFCSKFEIDKIEDISAAVDQLINSYLFSTSELLKRIDQKKEQICVSFIVRNYPSKYEIATTNVKGSSIVPASTIVSAAEAAFMSIAESFSTNVADREYLSVILAKCPYNNELFKKDTQLAQWILESFDSLAQQKHKQTAKQASVWNKVGAKLKTGFSIL